MKQIPSIGLNQNKPQAVVDPVKNPRSVFDISQSITTTINTDIVYPIFWEEVIPTDTFRIDTALGGRLATPKVPIMDNLQIQYDWWFNPDRLVWTNFVHFWGERKIDVDENVMNNYLVPIIDDTSKEYAAATGNIKTIGFGYDGLFNYLLAGNDVGVPMDTAKGNFITSLLARHYMNIGYKWYIDQQYGTVFINDLGAVESIGFIPQIFGDGPDDASKFQLFKKAKKKDYFTLIRPYLLNGDDGDVFLKDVLGTFVPLQQLYAPNDYTIQPERVPNATGWKAFKESTNSPSDNEQVYTNDGYLIEATGSTKTSLDPNGQLIVDISELGISMNNVRLYEKIGQYYERATRSGTRYVEKVFAAYGATPEDQRLQLPEWLGGWTERLQIVPVAQTSETGDTPLGDLAAFGTLVSRAPTITKSFSEHGFVMCLATVYPDLTYQRGIDIKLQRRTVYDFHDHLWENLTDRPYKKRELRVANNSSDDETLGYGKRFNEMKMGKRKLSGQMRSNHPQTLDSWTLAQDIPDDQDLDASFRTYDTDMGRVQAVSDQPALILYGEAKITAARPLQVNPIPMLGGF